MRARAGTRRRAGPRAATRRARKDGRPWGKLGDSSIRTAAALTSRRSRSAAIALLFALVPGLAAALDPELQLKVEKQLRMAPARPERDSAKFLEADRIEGQPDKNVVATGNVTMR